MSTRCTPTYNIIGAPQRDMNISRVANTGNINTQSLLACAVTSQVVSAQQGIIQDLQVNNIIINENIILPGGGGLGVEFVKTETAPHTANSVARWTNNSSWIEDSSVLVGDDGSLTATSLSVSGDVSGAAAFFSDEISSSTISASSQINAPELVFNNSVTLSSASGAGSYRLNLPPPGSLPSTSQFLGVQSVSGGSTINSNWFSIPGSIISQTVTVTKSAPVEPYEYSTIQAAIDYVITQSPGPDNQWLIVINPGIYQETNLDIPQYVSVQGLNAQTCIVQGLENDEHIFLMNDYTALVNLTIMGPTSSGFAAVYCNNSNYAVLLTSITIDHPDIGLLIENNSISGSNVFVYLLQCVIVNCPTHCIQMDASYSTATINYYSWSGSIYQTNTLTMLGAAILCQGPYTVYNSIGDQAERDFSNTPVGTYFQAQDGAVCHILSPMVLYFATGMYVPANLADPAPVLNVNAADFYQCITNINIQHPDASGYLFGQSPYTQTIYPLDSMWYVANKNPRILTVGTNPASDFLSISDALAAIQTVTSQTSRFIIQVSPGQYVLNSTIVMKSYVEVVGLSQADTVLILVNDVVGVILAPNSSISNITFLGTGQTSTASALVYQGSTTLTNVVFVQNVNFRNVYYGVLLQNTSPSYYITMQICNCTFFQQAAWGIGIDIQVRGFCGLSLNDIYAWSGGLSFQYFLRTSTTNINLLSTLNVSNCLLRGNITSPTPIGIGFWIETGTCNMTNITMQYFDQALVVPNTANSPILRTSGLLFANNTTSVNITNPRAIGNINGVLPKESTIIESETVSAAFADASGEGFVVSGQLFLGPTANTVTNISSQIIQGSSLGLASGGVLSANLLVVTATAGTGYVMQGTYPTDSLFYVEFASQQVTLSANTLSYLYINAAGQLLVASTQPNLTQNMLLGLVQTTSTTTLYIQHVPKVITHLASSLDNMITNAMGPLYQSGSITIPVQNNDPPNLTNLISITTGLYYYGNLPFNPAAKTQDESFQAFYRDPAGQLEGNWTMQTITTVPALWDDGSGTLQTVPLSEFVKHVLYVVGSDLDTLYMMVYGDQLFVSLAAAQTGLLPLPPSFFVAAVVSISALIVDSTGNLVSIQDIRPTVAFRSGVLSSTSNHSDLSNLTADDHKQYLLCNGTRAMAGTLNMGTNAVTNAGTWNGMVVTAHASRHLPGGVDPLPVDVPVPVGLVLSQGVQEKFARSDHVHTHGLGHAGGATHALADGTTAGFLSSTDYTTLQNATSNNVINTLVKRSGAGLIAVTDITVSSLTTGYLLSSDTNKSLIVTPLFFNSAFGVVGVGTTQVINNSSIPLQFNVSSTGSTSLGFNQNGLSALLIGYDLTFGGSCIRQVATTPLAFFTNTTTEVMRLTSSNDLQMTRNTADTLCYHNTNKAISSVTLGAGLSLVSGTLSVTGSPSVSTITILPGTLGGTLGNSLTSIGGNAVVNEALYNLFLYNRTAAGTTAATAEQRWQRVVTSTYQDFIALRGGTVVVGAGSLTAPTTSLSLNTSTGVLSLPFYTGASYLKFDNTGTIQSSAATFTTDVRAQLSAGLGVTYSNGVISIGQSVNTTDLPTFLSLELRWPGSTPFVDFTNDATSDCDARIILNNGTDLTFLAGGSAAISTALTLNASGCTATNISVQNLTVTTLTANYVVAGNASNALVSTNLWRLNASVTGVNTTSVTNNSSVPLQFSAGVAGESYVGFNKSANFGLLIGFSYAYGGGVIRQVTTDPMIFIVNNNTEAMRILSTGAIQLTQNTANTLCCLNSSKAITNAALGTNLSFSSGTLSISTSPAFTSVDVSPGALGTTVGNTLTSLTGRITSTPNSVYTQILYNRYAVGTTATSVEQRLQRVVDATLGDFIGLRGGTIVMGTGTAAAPTLALSLNLSTGVLTLPFYGTSSYLKTNGTGDISSNSTTFTNDVRACVSAGTNISITSGVIAVSKTLDGASFIPTYTPGAGVTSCTNVKAYYQRIGNVTTVSGKYNIVVNGTSPTSVTVVLTLPFNTTSLDSTNLVGTASMFLSPTIVMGQVSQASTSTATFTFYSTTGLSGTFLANYSFTYEVI